MLPSDYGSEGALLSPYGAYSPSAVAEAERVVYANYATEEDFQTLRYVIHSTWPREEVIDWTEQVSQCKANPYQRPV